jgi:hypothetical protein
VTVAELIKILENHRQDAPVELIVFGHSFHSERSAPHQGVMAVQERRDAVVIRQTIPGYDNG